MTVMIRGSFGLRASGRRGGSLVYVIPCHRPMGLSSLATAQWVCHPSPPPNGFVIPRGSASEARGICSYWQLTTDNWQLVLGGRDGHDPASRRRSHEGRRVGSVGGGKCAEEGVRS